MGFATDLLPLVLALAAILAVIIVPIWLTKRAPKGDEPVEAVEQLLQNPLVRRTILRLELGGILAGVVALLFATWGLYQANHQSRLAEAALRDQRISSAWQIMSQSGPTASGKAYALEVLANDTNERLVGLNLGCDTANLGPHRYGMSWQECMRPQVLKGIDLGRPDNEELQIDRSNFDYILAEDVSLQYALLSHSSFRHAEFDRVRFHNADLWRVSFQNSHMNEAVFDRVGAVFPDFSRATVRAKFERSSIFYGDFSHMQSANIVFRDVQLHSANFTGALLPDWVRLDGDTHLGNADVYPRIRQADGAYGGAPGFILSGATLCDFATDDKVVCWEGATQDFLDLAYYWEGEAPQGLDLLDQTLRIRPPCPRPPSADEEGNPVDVFRYADEVCQALPLTPISDLIATGVLPATEG